MSRTLAEGSVIEAIVVKGVEPRVRCTLHYDRATDGGTLRSHGGILFAVHASKDGKTVLRVALSRVGNVHEVRIPHMRLRVAKVVAAALHVVPRLARVDRLTCMIGDCPEVRPSKIVLRLPLAHGLRQVTAFTYRGGHFVVCRKAAAQPLALLDHTALCDCVVTSTPGAAHTEVWRTHGHMCEQRCAPRSLAGHAVMRRTFVYVDSAFNTDPDAVDSESADE